MRSMASVCVFERAVIRGELQVISTHLLPSKLHLRLLLFCLPALHHSLVVDEGDLSFQLCRSGLVRAFPEARIHLDPAPHQ